MPAGFTNTQDPKQAAQNQRLLVNEQGDQLTAQQQADAAQAGNNANQTQGWLNSYLQPMVEGTSGGFNQQEAGAIQNAGNLTPLSADQAASNYLTPQEQASIMGNTASYGANFNPNQMSQDQTVSAGQQRQAVDSLQQNLKGAIDPSQLQQSQTYAQNAGNTVAGTKNDTFAAIGGEANNVRSAIDPNAVTPSDQFNQSYQMTPQQQQDIVTGAGISAGAGYRAAEGTTARAAAAAGASPMGAAAYRARSERDAAAAGGDAMTQARIAASNAAASRQLTSEQLRENAGQFLTNTKTGTELQMGQQAVGAEQNLGQMSLAQQNTQEANRQAAQQYLTGANLNAATTGGEAQLANEANLNTQGRQVGQFNATTGANIAQAEDTANSGRATGIATNRQNTGVNNQQTQFGQQAGADTLQSNQAQTVGNARLGQQNAAISNYTGQQQQANANQQAADQRQVQTYGTQASAGNQAAGIQEQAAQNPALWQKIAGTAIGAAGAVLAADGGVATKPQLNIVGEDGPEWIGPIDGSEGGQVVDKPTLAMVGDKGKPEAIVPMSYRAKSKARPSMAFGQQATRKARPMYGEAVA